MSSSQQGGIALGPTDTTYTYSTTDSIFTNDGPRRVTNSCRIPDADPVPASPANIRMRRTPSTLLQSPARAGHAARMRQIFEEAGEKDVLYPQLPNISRKASSPPDYSQHHTLQPSPIRRPESLCMSTNSSPIRQPGSLCMSTSSFRIVPRQLQVPVSEQSSESWSDDSGYFIAGSRSRTFTHAVCPKERITDWLVSVSAPEYEEGLVETKSSEYLPGAQSEHNDYSSSKAFDAPSACTGNYKRCPPLQVRTQDPFIQDVNTPSGPSLFSTHMTDSTVIIRSHPSPTRRHPANLEEGGIQLSPLSPNVCIERGPARYHSAHRRSNADHTGSPITAREYAFPASPLSPGRERAPPRLQSNTLSLSPTREYSQVVEQLKENNATITGRGGKAGRDSPCKIGVGTRFQHPRHGMVGVSRFAHGVWGRGGLLDD